METDPFWLLVNLAFFIGLGFTILICGLWELAKLSWSQRPGVFRNISDRQNAASIRRLQRLSATLEDDLTTPWPMAEGASK